MFWIMTMLLFLGFTVFVSFLVAYFKHDMVDGELPPGREVFDVWWKMMAVIVVIGFAATL